METAAERCGVSLRTLTRLSAGKCVRLGTIAEIAKGLNIPLNVFLKSPDAEKDVSVRIEWVLSGPKELLTAIGPIVELLDKLAKTIGAKHEIKPKHGEYGSVLLDVEMHVEDVDALCLSFDQGKLKELQFTAINLRYYLINVSEFRSYGKGPQPPSDPRRRPFEFRGGRDAYFVKYSWPLSEHTCFRSWPASYDPAKVDEKAES